MINIWLLGTRCASASHCRMLSFLSKVCWDQAHCPWSDLLICALARSGCWAQEGGQTQMETSWQQFWLLSIHLIAFYLRGVCGFDALPSHLYQITACHSVCMCSNMVCFVLWSVEWHLTAMFRKQKSRKTFPVRMIWLLFNPLHRITFSCIKQYNTPVAPGVFEGRSSTK